MGNCPWGTISKSSLSREGILIAVVAVVTGPGDDKGAINRAGSSWLSSSTMIRRTRRRAGAAGDSLEDPALLKTPFSSSVKVLLLLPTVLLSRSSKRRALDTHREEPSRTQTWVELPMPARSGGAKANKPAAPPRSALLTLYLSGFFSLRFYN